mmetsp:Transcript_29657/g.95802  ORF Transcript_29657/g.95802 Transcript_29657/m.95802 type:complete len:227 (-) Transcript_29657:1107-1787(-)
MASGARRDRPHSTFHHASHATSTSAETQPPRRRCVALAITLTAAVLTRAGMAAPALLLAHLPKSSVDPLKDAATSPNRARPVAAPMSASGCGGDIQVGMAQPSAPHASAASAIPRHFCASGQLSPSRLAMPLIRMVARPSRTSSCGKDAMALMGELSLSSALEKLPGMAASGSPNRRSASAAAASGGASGLKVTPKPRMASWAVATSAGEPPVRCHSSTRSSASAI